MSSRRAAAVLVWLGTDGELPRDGSRWWLPAYYTRIIAYAAYIYIYITHIYCYMHVIYTHNLHIYLYIQTCAWYIYMYVTHMCLYKYMYIYIYLYVSDWILIYICQWGSYCKWSETLTSRVGLEPTPLPFTDWFLTIRLCRSQTQSGNVLFKQYFTIYLEKISVSHFQMLAFPLPSFANIPLPLKDIYNALIRFLFFTHTKTCTKNPKKSRFLCY